MFGALPNFWAGISSSMEGDVIDKLDDMASVYEFDPFTGNIPATKVEITVSCRWVNNEAFNSTASDNK